MMKKTGIITLVSLLFLSCSSMEYPISYPGGYSGVSLKKGQTSPSVEQKFRQLNAQYKQNTKELLEVMLDESPNASKVAVSVENLSSCNMVFTISGNGLVKEIPIGVGQTRGVVVPKGMYHFSSQVCASVYQQKKNLQESVNLQLRE